MVSSQQRPVSSGMARHFSIDSVIEKMADLWLSAWTTRDVIPHLTDSD